jgi:Flp pilus assembly protein TadD
MLTACSGGSSNRNSDPSLASQNPEGLVRVGEGFERTGNLQGALDLYNQALESRPELLSAEIARARLLTKTSRREEGIATLQKIYSENPNNQPVAIALVQGLIFSDRYLDAYQVVKSIVPESSTDIQALDLAGTLADINGESDKAKTFYDRALQVNPNDASVIKHLSISFALNEEYETATALLQGILGVPATEVLAKQTLANIYALSGQIEASNVIAKATFEPEQLEQWNLIYQLINTLTHQEKAVFLLLDILPSSVTERIQKSNANS